MAENQVVTNEVALKECLSYFKDDSIAATTFLNKYNLKNEKGEYLEKTPDDMHKRLAKEFARINSNYKQLSELTEEQILSLSVYGRNRKTPDEKVIYNYFKDFKQIIPQGSIMEMLGNTYRIGSLSNCFVIGQPHDSYGGILHKDEQLVQLMKRRGGVGIDISTLRPQSTSVSNSAGTSTGAVSFVHRYSNSTREVAQDGRRGALMITLDCRHPDLLDFIKIKRDKVSVSGANISVKFTNDFMEAVKLNQDYILRYPCDAIPTISVKEWEQAEYNTLYTTKHADGKIYWKRIKAKEVFQEFVKSNWICADPGTMFTDIHYEYSPDTVYEMYKGITTNPCGEIFMGAYDACRLIAINLLSVVVNPFSPIAYVDYHKLYELCYEMQVLADNLVDLELEHINHILLKIENDDSPEEIKRVERELWSKIFDITSSGRRTGCGFTALGDMLAQLGYKYDSDKAMSTIEAIMKTKMEAELDASIDMAIVRGTFKGWSVDKEYSQVLGIGQNKFYQNLKVNFTQQYNRMCKYGRRNVSWSTVAPTGTVSLLAQTTSGIEPLFEPFYVRRRKINSNNENDRVDFVDELGDKWQEFAILHPQFKEWIENVYVNKENRLIHFDTQFGLNIKKEHLVEIFKESPWYQSCANDIDWIKRVQIQAIVQKYTTHSISSTINLPEDVSEEKIYEIYMESFNYLLKGITVYRDKSKSGVLVTETKPKAKFDYHDAPKRPVDLEAQLYIRVIKGIRYAIIVGLLENKPYEVFAFENPIIEENCKGVISKKREGVYEFNSENNTIENLQLSSERADEILVCRMASMLLRHGANPELVIEQIEKAPLTITSFGKAIMKVLSFYIPEDSSKECPSCHEKAMTYIEGCKKCSSCGYTAC